MKKIYLLTIVVAGMFLQGCDPYEKGSIAFSNKVGNVRIQGANLGPIGLGSSLLPGQSTGFREIHRRRSEWPVIAPIEFYMEADGNTVYLRTKDTIMFHHGENLLLTIGEDTEVVNPLLDE